MHHLTKRDISESPLNRLCHLPDRPDDLYVEGTLDSLQDKKLITIVGSRTCSNYAKEITRKLITNLQGYPVCIVSGLALGIDTIAHAAALDSGICTVAFPGSGLDESVIYPASNRGLSRRILKNRGLLVSEYEPHTKAARWTFPKRNRLMAGVSDLVIIIEAQDKSGTLITARLAMEYGTTVAVIPQNITAEHAHGSNRLMQDGAHPILNYEDILHLVGLEKNDMQPTTHTLNKDEASLMQHLSSPTSKDELYKKCNLSYQVFITTLTTLELSGVVYEQYGKITKNTNQSI